MHIGLPSYYLLSAEERELVAQGEISFAETMGGGALSLWLGFGIGHVVQGRYSTVGWKFTFGELAAIGGIIVGARMASENGYNSDRRSVSGESVVVVSLIGYLVLRGWEAVDAFVGPSAHNRKVRAARWKAGGSDTTPSFSFYFMPSREDIGGGVAGLRLRF